MTNGANRTWPGQCPFCTVCGGMGGYSRTCPHVGCMYGCVPICAGIQENGHIGINAPRAGAPDKTDILAPFCPVLSYIGPIPAPLGDMSVMRTNSDIRDIWGESGAAPAVSDLTTYGLIVRFVMVWGDISYYGVLCTFCRICPNSWGCPIYAHISDCDADHSRIYGDMSDLWHGICRFCTICPFWEEGRIWAFCHTIV